MAVTASWGAPAAVVVSSWGVFKCRWVLEVVMVMYNKLVVSKMVSMYVLNMGSPAFIYLGCNTNLALTLGVNS